jgi:hypothetical protein
MGVLEGLELEQVRGNHLNNERIVVNGMFVTFLFLTCESHGQLYFPLLQFRIS